MTLHPLAECDREAALLYYGRDSEAAANDFSVALEQAKGAIARQPRTWRIFEGDLRRYKLSGFPFAIIYRLLGEEIWIIAIENAYRQPGYWRDRLQDLP